MIKKEFYKKREDGVNLYRTYSDKGYPLIQNETGNLYDETIDVENASFSYRELITKED